MSDEVKIKLESNKVTLRKATIWSYEVTQDLYDSGDYVLSPENISFMEHVKKGDLIHIFYPDGVVNRIVLIEDGFIALPAFIPNQPHPPGFKQETAVIKNPKKEVR